MSKVLDALRKRGSTEYRIGEATVWLRAMTMSEVLTQQAFSLNANESLRVGWAFGCSLTDAEGSPVFPRPADQSEEEYAKHVADGIGDIPSDVLISVSNEIAKINREAKTEAIRKNS